jgi:nitrous oxidase accessory protein
MKRGTIHLIKKHVVLLVFILFFGIAWSPSNGMMSDTSFSSQISSGSVFYVGGSGPNNYTTIQEAINNTADGDKVFVFSDTYYEHVLVNKSIALIGEDKNTTIIDGSGVGTVVLLSTDNITISGFTVQHSGDAPKVDAGIESRANRNTIFGNIVSQNGQYGVGVLLNGTSNALVHDNYISENGNEGVFLEQSTDAVVRDNQITRNGHCAVVISQSRGNTIIQNIMADNYAGVSLWPGATDNEITLNIIQNQTYSGVGIWPEADNNSIRDNVLFNNSLYGILITKANGNVIASNTIERSNEGIRLFMANGSTIQTNNFIENNRSAFFENSSFNRWRQNYWDDHVGIWPKCIHGLMRVPWNKMKVIRWINMDWRPAQEPYNISLIGGTVG